MFDLRDVHGEYLSAKGKVFDLRDVQGEYLSAKGQVFDLRCIPSGSSTKRSAAGHLKICFIGMAIATE